MTKQGIMILILGLAVIAGVGFWMFGSKTVVYAPVIANFEECEKAGYPIMESYPRQCRSVSGELFVEKIDNPNAPPKDDGRVAAGYVAGKVTIGPNCPGPEKIGEPCTTPPEAYSSRKIVVYESDAETLNTTGKIDSEGNYKIALGPGNYFIKIEPEGFRLSKLLPLTIKSFETTVINFDIDTGIR